MDDHSRSPVDDPGPHAGNGRAGLPEAHRPVATPRRSWRRWLLFLTILAVFGAAGWWHVLRPVQQQVRLRLSLANFGLLYHLYQRDIGRSPHDIDEFEAYLLTQSTGKFARECHSARLALELARNKQLAVIWSAYPSLWGNSQEYLAAETRTRVQGGLVLWSNNSVEHITPADWTRRAPTPSRTETN